MAVSCEQLAVSSKKLAVKDENVFKEIYQVVEKHDNVSIGHPERSEESRNFKRLRSFTAFRMTEKTLFNTMLEKTENVEFLPRDCLWKS
jgi:hypothetical protein